MTDAADVEPGQRRVLWRREVDETFDDKSIQRIREETGIEMPWYFDPDEWVVGYKTLEDSVRGNAFIEAVRLVDREGIAFELVSTIPDDSQTRWTGELRGIEDTIENIDSNFQRSRFGSHMDLGSRVDLSDIVVMSLTGSAPPTPDEVPPSLDAGQRAAEALQQFVSSIEHATFQFADSSQREAAIDAALNVIDHLASTQVALVRIVRQMTSEGPFEREAAARDAEDALRSMEPEPELTPRTYTVVEGDTLWDIAERFYGDLSNYQAIADASGISSPDEIQPGQELTIPWLQ